MFQKINFIILLFISTNGYSQTFTIGDLSNTFATMIGDSIDDKEMFIDIDCDNNADITFTSHIGGMYQYDWATLNFKMDSVTTVMTSSPMPLPMFK